MKTRSQLQYIIIYHAALYRRHLPNMKLFVMIATLALAAGAHADEPRITTKDK